MSIRLLFLCLSVCACNSVLNGAELSNWDMLVRTHGSQNVADEKLLSAASDGIDLKDFSYHTLSVFHVSRLFLSSQRSRGANIVLANTVNAIVDAIKGNPVLLGVFCAQLRYYVQFIPELTGIYNELLTSFNAINLSDEQEKNLLTYICTRSMTAYVPVKLITGQVLANNPAECIEIPLDVNKLQDRDSIGRYMLKAFENNMIELFSNKASHPKCFKDVSRYPSLAGRLIGSDSKMAIDILIQLTELLDINNPDHNNRDRHNPLVLDAMVEVGKVLKRLQQTPAQASV